MHFFAGKNSMSFALRVFHFSAWGTGKYVRSLLQPLLKMKKVWYVVVAEKEIDEGAKILMFAQSLSKDQ